MAVIVPGKMHEEIPDWSLGFHKCWTRLFKGGASTFPAADPQSSNKSIKTFIHKGSFWNLSLSTLVRQKDHARCGFVNFAKTPAFLTASTSGLLCSGTFNPRRCDIQIASQAQDRAASNSDERHIPRCQSARHRLVGSVLLTCPPWFGSEPEIAPHKDR